MTTISFAARDLRDAVSRAARAAGPDPANSIGRMRLRSSSGRLTCTCSDYGISIEALARIASSDGDAINLGVPAKMLASAVSACPGATIDLIVDGNALLVVSGKMRTRIPTVEYDTPDYIGDRAEEVDLAVIDIPGRDMAAVCALYSWTSNDASRPAIECVYVDFAGTTMRGVATDGHRLAWYERETGSEVGKQSFLVTGNAAREVASALGPNPAGTVGVATLGRNVFVRCGDCTVHFQVVEASFPDWRKIVPASNPVHVTAQSEALGKALARSRSVAGRGDIITKMEIETGLLGAELTISARNPDGIEVSDSLPVKAMGSHPVLGINGAYLSDAISLLGVADIRLEINDQMSPILICGDSCYRAVIMPMRL